MNKPLSSVRSKPRSAGKRSVLVIGGGVSGAAAAERLSRCGLEVHLVEKSPDIGGHAAGMGCKATDVCMRCNVCVADELFRTVREAASGPRRKANAERAALRLHTSTELADIQPGGRGARYAAVLEGKGRRRRSRVDADSIVIAVGYRPYDPVENSSFGYGAVQNVITGMEAEQQLAGTNAIFRPSDNAAPGRVAFIQCVGSRTEEIHRRAEDTDYCSAVCCSYALRMARLIKHQSQESQVTMFYMDIQKFGKGFEKFHGQCRENVRFVRSRPYELSAGPGETVLVKYADGAPASKSGGGSEAAAGGAAQAGVCEEEFDLVVLSVGIRPPPDGVELAGMLGAATDEQGFFGLKSAAAQPDLQKRGIYVVGAAESPKDIAGCIAQAESASASILAAAGAVSGRRLNKRARGINRDAAVVGGGMAGMQTALALAKLGHQVALIQRGGELGGCALAAPDMFGHLGAGPEEAEARVLDFMAGLAGEVKNEERIRVYLKTKLESVAGEQGGFSLSLTKAGKRETVQAGAIVFATGAGRHSVSKSGTGAFASMDGLLKKMRAGDTGRRIAILMDTDCEHGREAWIRSLTAALMLARRGIKVKIYCRNVRVSATGMEMLYRRAREAGAVVVKLDKKPVVSERDGRAVVVSFDSVAGVELSEEFDSAVFVDREDRSGNEKIREQVSGLRAGPDGELQYDNIWLLPGLTNRPGVFAVGAARGDSEYRSALTDAWAAANEVHALLSGDETRQRDDVAKVDAEKCVLCLTCLRVCPHGAITIDGEKKAAFPSPVSCKRCGLCVAECPARAIELPGFTDEEMTGKTGTAPKPTIFACENSAIPALNAAGLKDGKKVNIIEVPCAGEVEPRHVLSALEAGARRVMIIGCHPESCKYLSGSGRADGRMKRIRNMLEKTGYDASKARFFGISSVEPAKIAGMLDGLS